MQIPENISEHVQLVTAIVAVIAAIITLLWKFPDRRRKRLKDQYEALTSLLQNSVEEIQELRLEAAFRYLFGKPLTAHEIKFLVSKYSLVQIERYCQVKEYLTVTPNEKQICWTGKYKERWYRAVWIVVYLCLYLAFAGLAYSITEAPPPATTTEVLIRIVVFAIFGGLSALYGWEAARLWNARGVKDAAPDRP